MAGTGRGGQEAAPAARNGGSTASGRFSPALADPAKAMLSMAVEEEDVLQAQRWSWVPCSICCKLWL